MSSILQHMFKPKPPPPPPPPPPLKPTSLTNGNKNASPQQQSKTKVPKIPSPPPLPLTPSNKRNGIVPISSSLPSRTPSDNMNSSSVIKTLKTKEDPWKTSNDDFGEDETSPQTFEVPFFQDEECSDPEDEFSFTCCTPPFAPRYPSNPRPYREWDPIVLPANTNIPTSIGRHCKRCGKKVYLAELHLSSRGVYHTECYKCCLCGKSLDSWSVAEYKGELFCKGCYRRNFALHGCGFGVGAGVLQTP